MDQLSTMAAYGGRVSGALRKLRRARDEMHKTAAACRSRGLLDNNEVRELKLLLKSARGAKKLGDAAIAELSNKYTAISETLRARIAEVSGLASSPVDGNAIGDSQLSTSASSESSPRTGRSGKHLDSQELLAKRYTLVCAIARGVPLSDAILEAGLTCTTRAARNYVRSYESGGTQALVDRRTLNRLRKRPLMTDEIRQLVQDLWVQYPAAQPKAIWRKLKQVCGTRGLVAPGRHSVWRFLDGQSPAMKALRAGRLDVYKKELRSVFPFTRATRANEHFQLDHTELDIWARTAVNGEWRPSRVWLTTALDEFSRSIAGFIVSTKYPDAQTVALLLYHAILPKDNADWPNRGLPHVIDIDRGRDFLSTPVANACAALGILVSPNPPHSPDLKGKIERWFRTVDSARIRTMPGHKDAVGRSEGAARKKLRSLLTLSEIRNHIEEWVVNEYHAETHSATGVSPIAMWRDSVGIPRMPDGKHALDVLLLRTRSGKVTNRGILFRKQLYWCEGLASRVGTRVYLRYHPDDHGSVQVYDARTNTLIGEATASYTAEEVVAARRAHRRELKSLIERSRERASQITREGRAAEVPDRIPAVANTPDDPEIVEDESSMNEDDLLAQMELNMARKLTS